MNKSELFEGGRVKTDRMFDGLSYSWFVTGEKWLVERDAELSRKRGWNVRITERKYGGFDAWRRRKS